MTQNPFEAPRAPDAHVHPIGAGTFDLGRTLNDSWRVVSSDIGTVVGGMLVGMLMMMVGYVTIVGIFFILPPLLWGGVKWMLNLNDGRADFGDLFSGFHDYWPRTGGVLLLMVMLTLPVLPSYGIMFVGVMVEEPAVMMIGQLVTMVLVFTVMIRLYFAIFFIVDREMPALDAIKASWEITSQQKLNTFLLILLSQIIGSLGVLACFIGVLISAPMSYLMFASAYRQMVGPTE